MPITNDIDLATAYDKLSREALRLVRDGAAVCQETAQREARVDSGTMRREIDIELTDDGADVVSRAPYSFWVEHGTGVFVPGGATNALGLLRRAREAVLHDHWYASQAVYEARLRGWQTLYRAGRQTQRIWLARRFQPKLSSINISLS